MEQPPQWLNRASFEGRITFPENFELSVLDPFILIIEEDELSVIVGEERLTALRTWLKYHPAGNALVLDESTTPAPAFDASLPGLYKLVVPFLVYAAYAEYIFQGDIQPTDTGAVSKERENSEGLSDTRIMQLYRSYRDRANIRAGRITTYIQTLKSNACQVHQTGFSVRISSSGGRTKSILD